MREINFIAIDFETATGKRASICEAGICVVRDGEIVETRSWLVRPQGNSYSYWNMQIHGIRPNNTENSPEFPEVWAEIAEYLKDIPVLVAHNAAFDIGCIRHSLTSVVSAIRWSYTVWRSRISLIIVPCARHAGYTTSVATVWITFATNSRYLTGNTTGQAMMPRCAHGCFCRNWRMPGANWKKWIIAMVNYRENDY